MPAIGPISAIEYTHGNTPTDFTALVSPPYDVLGEADKQALLSINGHNIVAVDLPHIPPKTEGPAEVYVEAGQRLAEWIEQGVMVKREKPAVYVYRQTYEVAGVEYRRCGLIANVQVQPFGPACDGSGGIFPHEQTFSGPKQDRFNLMAATKTQLSPIFGLYSDAENAVGPVLQDVIDAGSADYFAKTANDGVLHEVWAVDNDAKVGKLTGAVAGYDIFIADGHHRFNTAINYRQSLVDARGGLPADHKANWCMFVLVAMQDPGMVVLPTHRVFAGMKDFSIEKLAAAGDGILKVTPFDGDLAALEKALDEAAEGTGHAFGLYCPGDATPCAIATTVSDDPLAEDYAGQSEAWRQLDVAILQYLIVEKLIEPTFCDKGEQVEWRFPHSLEEVVAEVGERGDQLAVIVRATPLESVRLVSEAGELMPQKSTFFYPKLATGFVLNELG